MNDAIEAAVDIAQQVGEPVSVDHVRLLIEFGSGHYQDIAEELPMKKKGSYEVSDQLVDFVQISEAEHDYGAFADYRDKHFDPMLAGSKRPSSMQRYFLGSWFRFVHEWWDGQDLPEMGGVKGGNKEANHQNTESFNQLGKLAFLIAIHIDPKITVGDAYAILRPKAHQSVYYTSPHGKDRKAYEYADEKLLMELSETGHLEKTIMDNDILKIKYGAALKHLKTKGKL